MEEALITDANNVTADTFCHTPNTQRENANIIFTSENLDKLDELADALKYLIIRGAEFYESDTATANDAQGDSTRDQKTATHTSNGNEKITETSNGNFEENKSSNRTLPVVVLMVNLRID